MARQASERLTRQLLAMAEAAAAVEDRIAEDRAEREEKAAEHLTRRVTRTEYDGTITVVCDRFESKRLNSPNDVAVHQDGSIWFTDPPYGINGAYEGFKADKEVKEAVYRVRREDARDYEGESDSQEGIRTFVQPGTSF